MILNENKYNFTDIIYNIYGNAHHDDIITFEGITIMQLFIYWPKNNVLFDITWYGAYTLKQ